MSWQERRREIGSALRILKNEQRKVGKKGARIHGETYLDRVAKIIALKSGPCRDCQGLEIIPYEESLVAPDVSLKCNLKQSPLSLHLPYATSLGEVPSCPSRVPFEQEEGN